jgi:ribosome-associated heat shock protein Hsp15
MAVVDATRVDRWLWAVRVFKTRSQASAACQAGHVQVGDRQAKPSTTVRVGDRVVVRDRGFDRTLEVTRVIEMRVSPALALECLVDHSPPRPPREEAVVPLFVRDRAAGRPTKRERRQLDRFRAR